MRRLVRNGVNPTEVSILKWYDIAYRSGRDIQSKNCALCYTNANKKGCVTCVLSKINQECNDTNSVYKKYLKNDSFSNACKMIEVLEQARLYELLRVHGVPEKFKDNIRKEVIKELEKKKKRKKTEKKVKK